MKPFDWHSVQSLHIKAPNWIGDVVMAQPAMSALVRAFPDVRFSISGRPWLKELLPFLGLGSLPFSTHIPKDAQTILLFPNSFRSAWDAFRARIPIRIGFATQGRGPLLTHAIRPSLNPLRDHHRLYYLDLIKQLGVEIEETEVKLTAPTEAGQRGEAMLKAHGLHVDKTIAVAPGASYGGAKRYPTSSFASVLSELGRKGWHIVVLGTAQEREHANACLVDVSTPSWNACGELPLSDALACLSVCRLLISNDSGLMHVAAGLGIPVTAMFGATDPHRTSPSGVNVKILYHPAPCSPCLKRECSVPGQPCMNNILPEEVVEACLAFLSQGAR